ncbi:MAG: hypothetical protein HO274_02755 [Ferrovum myxofaciens]|uniref:hypothetical protein n=1 Tax=Ferrovum myxofaciens TaxID=416213 RepID=UPI002357389C|nr:hypothetical protein [Ferrovum myxofaciens]QKE40370.1 MAG: hypothetical protein HO274_02755 [Ferrovum myxofaciens]
MSLIDTLESDAKSALDSLKTDFAVFESWLSQNPIGAQIVAEFKAAAAELNTVAVTDLENAVKQVGIAVLKSTAAGSGSGAAITAGIDAARAAFTTLGRAISEKTIATLATTVVNGVNTIKTA